MDFEFKIFGTPHVFDLYRAGDEDVNYFQIFFNNSKENVKLTVHRREDGRVSYSYLRYHFLSNGNRTGGFFGMSVMLNGQYCKDAEGLYELFDKIYTDVILRNEILLKAIVGSSAGSPQAKYLVDTFDEAEDEVKRIESIVRKNLLTNFADDMFPVAALPPVKPENAGLIKKLKYKSAKLTFVSTLKQYEWVALSPEYSSRDSLALSLSPKEIDRLKKTGGEVLDKISEIAIEALNKRSSDVQNEIDALLQQTEDGLNKMQPYLNKQAAELIEINNLFKKNRDKLAQLKTNLEKLPPPEPPPPPQDPPQNPPPPPQPPQDPWIKFKHFFRKRKRTPQEKSASKEKLKISKEWAIACIALLAIVIVLGKLGFQYKPFSAPPQATETSGGVPSEETKSKEEKTEPAIVPEKEGKEKSNPTAIEQLRNKAKAAFDNSGKRGQKTKMEGYKSAIAILQELKSLGAGKQFEEDSTTHTKNAIDLFNSWMNSPKMQERKKEYAGYILEIDPNHVRALAVKNFRTDGNTTTATTEEKITIHVTKGNQSLQSDNKGVIVIHKGDRIEVTARQGSAICTRGVWRFEGSQIRITDPKANPVGVEALSASANIISLKYTEEATGKELASIRIKIM